METGGGFKEALMKEGGCGIVIYAAGLFMLGTFLYGMITGFGDPEIKKIQERCWMHESDRIGRPGVELSDQERFIVIRRCDAVIKRYIEMKREK